MKLSVIIVSYNVKYYLEQCLETLYRSGEGVEMEIFVVDNASTDGTQEYLKTKFSQEKFPTLRLIENTVNIGFGKANNLALRESKGEYILFINPDTMVGEECLKTCVNFLDKHEDAGALGVRMLKPNGAFAPESRRGMPTPFTSLCKVSGLSKMFPRSRLFGRYYMQYQDEWKENKIDVVSGAFMMVKHQVLDRVGGFDEDFFMYYEDEDLCQRIRDVGKKVVYFPKIKILHWGSQSVGSKKTQKKYFYESQEYYFQKHLGRWQTLALKILRKAVLGV